MGLEICLGDYFISCLAGSAGVWYQDALSFLPDGPSVFIEHQSVLSSSSRAGEEYGRMLRWKLRTRCELGDHRPKKKKEAYKRPRTLTEINNGHKVLFHGGIVKVHGGLLIPMKVTMEMNQVLIEQGDPLLAVFSKILRKKTFINSIYSVRD